MSASTEIEKISDFELKSIYTEYKRDIKEKIENIYENDLINNTLVEDIKPNILSPDGIKKVAILDVGGSFFKIAIVELTKEGDQLSYDIKSVVEFPYPKETNRTKMQFWFDWVAKRYIKLMVKKNVVPDICSLIFSYPIKYEYGGAYVLELAKHWCFESTTSLNMDLEKYLNEAIDTEILENYSFIEDARKFYVNSVLNDSVATLFSSKLISNKKSVGVILGTGTNGAIYIEYNGRQHVFNTEWGSYNPTKLTKLPEEVSFIESLKKKYNMLDILVGNGYKWNLINEIIDRRELSLEKYEEDLLGPIMERVDSDPHKKIAQGLIIRSRQIMSMLVCAVIANYGESEVLVLLNGSGYGNKAQRLASLKMIREYSKSICDLNVEIDVHYEDGLTFIGAAYYAYAKTSN
ncbi:hypothetical protein P3W45_001037 [Vairimorpha bombi]